MRVEPGMQIPPDTQLRASETPKPNPPVEAPPPDLPEQPAPPVELPPPTTPGNPPPLQMQAAHLN